MTAVAFAWLPASALAQGELFPEPFQVEHHLVRTAPDGTVTTSEPVVDTYGGSWIVSQRGDGSRLIVDLARREMTEIRPERGQYSRIGFDRLRELQHRLARVADPTATELAERARRALPLKSEGEGEATRVPAIEPRIERVAKASSSAPPEAGSAIRARGTVDRLVVSASLDPERSAARRKAVGLESTRAAKSLAPADSTTVEVWVDRSVTLGAQALAALSDLEMRVLGPPPERAAIRPPEPAALVAAARKAADGAFAVYTRRVESARPEDVEAPRQSIEDVVTRLERLERFPLELVRVPEGMERATHPLEVMAQYAEDDAALRDALGGAGDAQ